MQDFYLWPYDEVSLRYDPARASVSVAAPWLVATAEVTPDRASAVAEVAKKLCDGALAPDDLPLVQDFFAPLDEYPFCYVLPAKKDGPDLDRHATADAPLSLETGVSLARKEWAWDWEAASAFARAEGGIHPESLFSVARRFHLLDLDETCDSAAVFTTIAALPPDARARASALLVRQNHYVTQKCREALLPALGIAGRARPLVERFMRDETGHDRILERALRTFTATPEDVPVGPHTRALMRMLEYAAGRNFLAFAMAIDFFERSSYEKVDPLAQLLASGGFAEAASHIGRHSAINDAGGHENVARGFLAPMALCPPEYAREAFHIAETISLLIMSVPRAALDLYRS